MKNLKFGVDRANTEQDKVIYKLENSWELYGLPRHIVRTSTSIRFYENQPNDICSHLSEKASKGKFIKPEKLQNHSNEEKEKEKKERARRRKGREEKKKKKQWLHS